MAFQFGPEQIETVITRGVTFDPEMIRRIETIVHECKMAGKSGVSRSSVVKLALDRTIDAIERELLESRKEEDVTETVACGE